MHHVEIDPGLTVCRVASPRSTVVPELVVARLIDEPGPVHWIDARNAARTHALYDCAPSPSTLDSVRIARAFTAYQHHSLVRTVAREASSRSSLIVAPNVASLYRDDDLADWERERLLAASVATLRELADSLAVPVLVTTDADEGPAVLDEHAEHAIECRQTRMGTHLSGDGVESVGYRDRYGWQTTIPYWVDLYGTIPDVDPAIDAHDRGLLAPDLTQEWATAAAEGPIGPDAPSVAAVDGGDR